MRFQKFITYYRDIIYSYEYENINIAVYNINNEYEFIENNYLKELVNIITFKDVNSIKEEYKKSFIAVYNKNTDKTILLNDYFGLCTIYWKNECDKISFDIDLKNLKSNEGICEESIDMFFSLQYIPSPYTIWSDIYKMKSGEMLVCENSMIKSTYKKLGSYGRKDEFKILDIKEFRKKEGNQYCFLSGGLDSSTNIYYLSEINEKKPIGLNAYFGYKDFDESSDAEVMSPYCLKMYKIKIDIDDVYTNFSDIVSCYDEPIADMASVSTYILLSKVYISELDSLFSGEGGDEMFGLPRRFKKEFINMQIDKLIDEYIKEISIMNKDFKSYIYKKNMKNVNKNFLKNEFVNMCIYSDNILNIYNIHMNSWFPSNALTKDKKIANKFGIKIYFPLANANIENKYIIKNNNRYVSLKDKKLLRNDNKNILPKQILEKSKQSYKLPFKEWMQESSFKKFIYSELFNSANSRLWDYIDKEKLYEKFQSHCKGNNYSREFWLLLTLNEWLKQNV